MNSALSAHIDNSLKDAGRSAFLLQRLAHFFPNAQIEFREYDAHCEWASLVMNGRQVRIVFVSKGNRIVAAARLAKEFWS